MKNLQKEKTQCQEKESTKSKGLQGTFHTLLQIQLSRARSLWGPPCLMEIQMYKYHAHRNQSADVTNLHNCKICTLRFLHNCSDYALNYWEWFLLSFITARAREEDVATFKIDRSVFYSVPVFVWSIERSTDPLVFSNAVSMSYFCAHCWASYLWVVLFNELTKLYQQNFWLSLHRLF